MTPHLKPDEAVFVQTSSSAGARILHAGRVLETDLEGGYLARFDKEELPVEEGQDVVLFYEWNRRFTQQPARVTEVELGATALHLGLQPAGDPTSAESRQCYRVSAIADDLRVSLDAQEPCDVLDVSANGFSIYARQEWAPETTLDAVLIHGDESIRGQVRVMNSRRTGTGRLRCGLQCIEDPYGNSLLLRALPRINLAIQREQLARRAGLSAGAPPARFVPRRGAFRVS